MQFFSIDISMSFVSFRVSIEDDALQSDYISEPPSEIFSCSTSSWKSGHRV